MPRGDRTGPAGAGQMTGRGAGYCTGNAVPGYMNPAPGYGRGMAMRRGFRGGGGGGFGRGFGAGYYGPAYYVPPQPMYQEPPAMPVNSFSPEAELNALTAQAGQLQATLESIQQRIDELEASNATQKEDKKS